MYVQKRSLLRLFKPCESVLMPPSKKENGAATTPTPMYRRPIRAGTWAQESRLKAATTSDKAVRASVHSTARFSPARHSTRLCSGYKKMHRNTLHAALVWRRAYVGRGRSVCTSAEIVCLRAPVSREGLRELDVLISRPSTEQQKPLLIEALVQCSKFALQKRLPG